MVSSLAPKKLLLTASLFGVTAATLLFESALGLNVALAGILAATGCIALNRVSEFKLTKTSLLFLLIAAFFALMFGFRDAAGLRIANSGAMIIAFGGCLLFAKDANSARASFPALIVQPVFKLFQTLPWAAALGRIIQQSTPKNPSRTNHTSSVMVGATVATPLLLIFGGLFYSADAMFKSHVDSIASYNFDPTQSLTFLAIAAPLTVLASGSLYRFFMQASDTKPPVVNKFIGPPQFPGPISLHPSWTLGSIEISVILGSLVALFSTFIATQFESLFGGAHVITSTTGLTAAEYARSGFFQLVWVAALSLATILCLDKLQTKDSTVNKWLNRCLIGLVFLVIGSAGLRMAVYTQTFGLTELRIYTSIFMVWVALAFAWLIPTVTNNNRHRFGYGALLAGFAVIATMNFANPEAIITRTNLAMKSPDLQYIASLSADAQLEWQNNKSIDSSTRKSLIEQTLSKNSNHDWRSTNLSQLLMSKN